MDGGRLHLLAWLLPGEVLLSGQLEAPGCLPIDAAYSSDTESKAP